MFAIFDTDRHRPFCREQFINAVIDDANEFAHSLRTLVGISGPDALLQGSELNRSTEV